ncbi:MAG TPA: type VI secretion system tube protein TssD [Planctomycetota bacterium]|nr:type VI secretion system tube protein TssD [Planctomycetota bacterium]
MPFTAYLKAEPILGWPLAATGTISAQSLGWQDAVPVVAFTHEVVSPVDFQTGLPREKLLGDKKTIHKPFVITKKVDFTTPFFHKVYMSNDALTSWVLKLIHQPLSGPEAVYFSVTLTNARVVSIQTTKPSLVLPTEAQAHELEEIAFSYDQIRWEAPENVPLGMDFGKAPHSFFEDKGNFEPDIVVDLMTKLAKKVPETLADIIKLQVQEQLLKAGIQPPKKTK